MKKLDVCLTPELLHLFNLEGKAVVIVDILRATTSMVTAIEYGVGSIIPVASLVEANEYKKKGYITAAERDGKKAEGFDLGNSPFSFMDDSLVGKTIVMTTTNGTLAISRSTEAAVILIGAFINMGAVCEYLRTLKKDVVVVCAGWKGNFNLEDTLFAGALVEELKNEFSVDQDAALASHLMYNMAKGDMKGFLDQSSHVRRLNSLEIEKDVEYALTHDLYDSIPLLKNGALIKLDVKSKVSTP